MQHCFHTSSVDHNLKEKEGKIDLERRPEEGKKIGIGGGYHREVSGKIKTSDGIGDKESKSEEYQK